MKSNRYRHRPVAILASTALLAGCAIPNQIPPPLIFDRTAQQRGAGQLGASPTGPAAETPIIATPRAPAQNAGNLRPTPTAPPDTGLDEAPSKDDISISIEQMPLPAFIQAMYGGVLKLNYSVDASVAGRTELVTFRTPRALSARKLTELTRLLLNSYGIAVQDFGGVLRVVPNTANASVLPQIRRGRAQATVPLPLRPIFHYIELEAVRVTTILPTLKKVLGEKVQIQEDQANGILLSGPPDDVKVAMEILQVFDQPGLKSQRSVRVAPRFWAADEFSRRLTEVLRVEGYAAANTADAGAPLVVLPIPNLNSVIVFAQTDEIIAHVLDWARELDQLSQVQAGNTMFSYPVKNADASELARSLNDLISGTTSTPTVNASASSPLGATGAPGAAPAATVNRRRGVVVNNATNSLIFQGGNQEEYRQWLGLLTELDKPAKSALIDVLVAEVTLSNTNSLGFSWTIDRLAASGAIRTVSRATLGSDGLTANVFGGNGLHRLVIDALASDTDSRVISNPKIMAKNGETANINVGQEVPTVASQAVTSNSSIFGSNSAVVPQTIQYRNTGVLLRVRPVIHSGDRIDLDISQEVSRAVLTRTGVTNSPTINNTKVETKLTLRDGATVMLAGLISEESSNSDSGVPYAKDIPLLGNLFKATTQSRDRKELVVLITPYILNDSDEAESITESYQQSLGAWAQGVRDRTRLSREARPRSSASGVPAEASEPTSRVSPAAPSTRLPSPSRAPTSAVPRTPAQSSGVLPSGQQPIGLEAVSPNAPRTPPAVAAPESSAPSLARPATAPIQSPVPAAAGAPATTQLPSGVTTVTDPALLEELRRARQR